MSVTCASVDLMRHIAAGDVDAVWKFNGDINEPDAAGYTPARYALRSFDGVTERQMLDMLNALLSKGANFHAGWKDFTMAGWAAHDPLVGVAVLQWLVEEAGMDVNEPDRTGARRVPIQYAISASCVATTAEAVAVAEAKMRYLMRLPQLDVRGEPLLKLAQTPTMRAALEECLVRVLLRCDAGSFLLCDITGFQCVVTVSPLAFERSAVVIHCRYLDASRCCCHRLSFVVAVAVVVTVVSVSCFIGAASMCAVYLMDMF